MLKTVSFFVVFILIVQMTKFDPIESSDQILSMSIYCKYRILDILGIAGLLRTDHFCY